MDKKYDPKKKILYTPLGPIKVGPENAKVTHKATRSRKEFFKVMREASEAELFALPEGYAE